MSEAYRSLSLGLYDTLTHLIVLVLLEVVATLKVVSLHSEFNAGIGLSMQLS